MNESPRIRAVTSGDGPPPAGAYSPAVVLGELVFVSGQAPVDPATGEVLGRTIGDQTRLTLSNLEAILEAAGSSLRDVAKVTVHLSDFSLFEEFDAAYREVFAAPFPARTTVESGLGDIDVEIDAIAALTRPDRRADTAA